MTDTINTFLPCIDNEVLIALLGLIFAFAGIISFILAQLFKRDILITAEKLWKEERKISRADISISLSYFHIRLYKTLYEEKTVSTDENGKAKNEIEMAISKVQVAINELNGIEEKKCLRQIFLTKNNLAYYLARKWNYYREKKDNNSFKKYLEENNQRTIEYKMDKEMAEECVRYLKNKKAQEKYPDLSPHLEDTFIWVEKIFSVIPKLK